MSNYIIVGATGDIGREIHSSLSSHDVITVSKSSSPELDSTHHFLDVSKAITEEVVMNIIEGTDEIDGLIWAPGVSLFKMLEDTHLDEVDKQYHISIRSLVAFIKILLPKLKCSEHGRIIVISSIWGRVGASFESVYSAMKGAEEALVKSLAKELAGTTITVNAVAPGVVSGKMTEELQESDLSYLLDELPQGRFVEPNEISHAVLYLLDKNASSITGEVLNINGGWYT